MPKRILIKHLDLGDGRYIENDKVKDSSSADDETEYMSWDELWSGVKSDIKKIQRHLQGNPSATERHNQR